MKRFKKVDEKLNCKDNMPCEEVQDNAFLPEKCDEKSARKQMTKTMREKKSKKIKNKAQLQIEQNIIEAQNIATENKNQILSSPEEKLELAEKENKKIAKKSSTYFYVVCFLINVVSFTSFLLLNSQSRKPIKVLFEGSPWWLVLAFSCIVIITIFEAIRVMTLIFKSTKQVKFGVAYNSSAISRFYDLITPLSTGGQSRQISYLSKSSIKGSVATSVPIAKYVFAQFCYLIFITIILFVKQFGATTTDFGTNLISVFAYIGLAFQLFLVLCVLFLSVSKKVGPAITIWCLKVLAKLHIIKDYKKVYIKVLHFVNDYQTSMRKMVKSFLTFFTMTISSFLIIVVRFLIPFFLYCAFFGFNAAMIVPIFIRIVISELAMGIWILPGNVIFADLIFFTVFKSIFVDGTLFWALLFWRLITYYLLLLQGVIVIAGTNSAAKRRLKRLDNLNAKNNNG